MKYLYVPGKGYTIRNEHGKIVGHSLTLPQVVQLLSSTINSYAQLVLAIGEV